MDVVQLENVRGKLGDYDISTDDDLTTNHLGPRIAERLRRRKGKKFVVKNSPTLTPKHKLESVKEKYDVSPAKSWGKFVAPLRKRKVVSSSEYEFEGGEYVQDIIPHKKSAAKKDCVSVPKKHAERWKYVEQRRIALEKELGKDLSKCKEVTELVEAVGLRRIVIEFGPCYERLEKEFVVIVPVGCDDANRKDYKKVKVRGNMVNFSPAVINKFLGRFVEPQPELEVTDNQVCREIIDG